jgi:enoyl-CoA hydratase/carnithine racemase
MKFASSVSDLVRYETEGKVGLITFNRPAKLNAINTAMARGLVDSLEAARGVRALILTGAGGNFCAGWDLRESGEDGSSSDRDIWTEGVSQLAKFPVPTLAAIEGHCLGQGLLYAICCDLRVAGERARLGFPEVRRGFFAGAGASQRIHKIIGPARAKELMFFGRPVSAETALTWGLVNRVAPDGQAVAMALEMATELAAGPTKALGVIKRLVDEGAELPLDEGIELEAKLGMELDPAEANEGVAAFLERRTARFPGA